MKNARINTPLGHDLILASLSSQRALTLADASRALAEAGLDAERVLHTLAQRMGETLDCGVVVVLMDEAEHLRLNIAFHRDPALVAGIEAAMREQPFDKNQGITGHTVSSGRTLYLPDPKPGELENMVFPLLRPWLKEHPVSSLIVTPMKAGDRILGGVALFRFVGERPFVREDRAFTEELSIRAAWAVEHARALGSAQREKIRLEGVIESMVSGVAVTDPNGQVALANRRAAELLRVEKPELKGPLLALLPSTPSGGRARLWQQALAGETVRGAEELWTTPGSSKSQIVRWGAAPLVDAKGAVDGVVWVLEDVTHTKVLERALARRADDLTFLSRGSVVLSESLDVETIRHATAACAVPRLGDGALIDVSEEFVGLVPAAVAVPADREQPPGLPALMNEALASGHALKRTLSAHEGMPNAVSWAALVVPIRARGRTLGVLALWRSFARPYDDEDVALAEEWGRRAAMALENAGFFREAEAARRELEQADRSRNEFVAKVSHELRTPLAAILMWAHVLRHGRPDDAEMAVEAIEASARAQSKIIGDLLDVLRGTSGKLRLDMAPCDLAAIVRNAVDAHRAEATERGQAFGFAVVEEPLPVLGDRLRLEQVVANLLSNALKFTPSRGRIDVTLEKRGLEAVLVVADNGRGIESDRLADIFTPFRQGEDAMRAGAGLGLGLAIVRQLVDLHGGSVWAESEGPGKGSQFFVSLPVSVSQEVAPPPETPSPVPRLDGVAIVLLEDDLATRHGLARVLSRAGAEVREAGTIAEARQAVLTRPPDVLVSDLALPDGTGFELISGLRIHREPRVAQVPAVAVTAMATDADRAHALEAGFDAHLAKPADVGELIRLAANLASGRR